MKTFLKPTKITWIAFVALLAFNVPVFLVGLGFGIGRTIWSLILVPLFQVGWLYNLFHWAGIDVRSPHEFVDEPNFLGWILIVMGTLITLAVYYFIASLISKYYYRRKNMEYKILPPQSQNRF